MPSFVKSKSNIKSNVSQKKYSEIKEITFRSRIRHGLIRVLHNALKVENKFYKKETNKVQFLYGHHILNDEINTFRGIIEKLKSNYDFIPYSEAVQRVVEGPIDKSYVSLSFDDGFHNCIRIGRILSEYEISACFFICPGVIGSTDNQTLRMFANRTGMPLHPLSWNDVEVLQSLGHEIGGHTYTHRNLADSTKPEMKEEITKTRKTLKRYVEPPIHFAWPYGRFEDFTSEAASTVFKAGFASCASAVRGCHSSVHDRDVEELCIRRDLFVAGRPMRNLEVFLELNDLLPWRQQNGWPSDWNVK